jgi:hypothetical protein
MKGFRACVLLALFVGTVSYGLVFSTCALNPNGSCSTSGFGPVHPKANQVVVTNGENPADPSEPGSSSLIF